VLYSRTSCRYTVNFAYGDYHSRALKHELASHFRASIARVIEQDFIARLVILHLILTLPGLVTKRVRQQALVFLFEHRIALAYPVFHHFSIHQRNMSPLVSYGPFQL
jgi:hypothetical protein